MKMPIFVARQLVRHRTQSINELSGRYSELPAEYYVPDEICAQSTTNKQGRGERLDRAAEFPALVYMEEAGSQAFGRYDEMLASGVARETARMVLPLSTYTQWCTTMSLHNLLHMLELRLDPHAQWECRVYAEAIAKIVEDWCPIIWEAFVDYRLEAVTFSRREVALIRATVQRDPFDEAALQAITDLSKREREEFLVKLGCA
jgi:thymidylate synthase (FAD)